MKMNTPTAIFLGLTLIAVAIFFRQPSISEAQAGIMSGGEMIATVANDRGVYLWHLKDGKVRVCEPLWKSTSSSQIRGNIFSQCGKFDEEKN